MPSRQFLISQAVLDADMVYSTALSTRYLSRAERLSTYAIGDWVRTSFRDEVRTQYRDLVAIHGAPQ